MTKMSRTRLVVQATRLALDPGIRGTERRIVEAAGLRGRRERESEGGQIANRQCVRARVCMLLLLIVREL